MKKINTYNVLQFDDSERYRKQMIKSVSRNIRNIRQKKNWTQEQLAEAVGTSGKYISEIERGLKIPGSSILIALSQALGSPVCELVHANYCPYTKNKYLKKIRELFTGRQDNEQQKATRVIQLLFFE
ncbi:MAG: helix-turn-helix transcriptional regulator [Thermodesulfovibrionales bacterium]|nr:helix-turn-helix transcriptional regulator [Thermodesulfovibrionales bacterium]